MRDLDTLLNSLVNVDRKSLIAILMSEAEKAEHQVRFSRHRTGAQREKHRAVIELLARIRQILSFLQDGQIAPNIMDNDIALCKSLEEKLRAKGSW
jgi:hypothetical protein